VNYNLNAGPSLAPAILGLPEFTAFGRTASTNLLFAGYSSSYHALQVKFDRKFTGGLSTTTAYTFGKGMGFQTGDDGGLFFYINQRRNYARNDFDRTQTFVQSFVYDSRSATVSGGLPQDRPPRLSADGAFPAL